ncbi:hydroxymethylbilane synthase [Leucobacter coleopterorum]|uniref:Hydroxymethylbilane synthase n=1 Tax=Leucobacter coleopterorum TaxID=2714933 RepID=A0ABX6K138_9MICO|nr:hydroxymethylbilane synthase [Leucobacter coleopterorum]QIM19583.1 hydroxymethylbilane synthase [Leucobacter coleopterorum]
MRGDTYLSPQPGLIRFGTRRSRLAVAQTTQVAEKVARETGADVALVTVTTKGDVSRAPLAELGGTGVFVSALRDALLDNRCDLAVHSFKDLPTGPCEGIVVGAVPERADPRDALCARDGLTLAELPTGARVGTGSPRRAAQVLAVRPDLQVEDIRGNIDTRLSFVGDSLDAVVLAAAGLDRADSSSVITERFDLSAVPTAAGQGALAVEVRGADSGSGATVLTEPRIVTALRALEHPASRMTAEAERSVLLTLEAGCAAPIGATAHITGGKLQLRATVYRTDGTAQLEVVSAVPLGNGTAGEAIVLQLGRDVAGELLSRGAAELTDLGAVLVRQGNR